MASSRAANPAMARSAAPRQPPAPRLARFVDRHPDIDLRVTASRELVDFRTDQVDAAIPYGRGEWPGTTAQLLACETVFPVCTRAYAQQAGPGSPADVANAALLHSDIEENWHRWFEAAELSSQSIPNGPRLGDDSAILQAALDHQGLALGRSLLVADDIAQGRLIAPFDIFLTTGFSYWLVRPQDPARDRNRKIGEVCNWIVDNIGTASSPPP